MKCRYILLKCILEKRESYGVAAVCDYDDTEVILESFTDLSTDRIAIEEFVNKCNLYELSICHLGDAVDDLLAEL
jgi:hypothetical protein